MNELLQHRTFQIVFLTYSCLLLFLGRQVDRGLPNFDDAFYAQKAKEMLPWSNPWVVTHRGIPRFDNPPLPFWVTAVFYRLLGVSEYSATLFTALLGTATVLLTYLFCHHLFRDRWVAFTSAFVLLFPGPFVDASRRVMLDIPVTFFVTAALFGFVKARENRRYYLLFGLMTALGILTKSVFGALPIVIGLLSLMLARRWEELRSPFLWLGVGAALLGFSWHVFNWITFRDEFTRIHVLGILLDFRSERVTDPLYFLGYARDFLVGYWPWLPFAILGLVRSTRRARFDAAEPSALLAVWTVVVFVGLSAMKTQNFRYMCLIFPTLAMLTSKTLFDWLSEATRRRMMPILAGVIMASVLLVNATPFQAKVTLMQQSTGIRDLVSAIRANTPPGHQVENYRLAPWDPRDAFVFYTDRDLGEPLMDPQALLERMEESPDTTCLSTPHDFRELAGRFPGKLYLIQASADYAYFTSRENRKKISYDFSPGKSASR